VIICLLLTLFLSIPGIAGESLDQLREMYHGGRYEEALELIDPALKNASRADSAEILYYQAAAERVAELAEIKMMELTRAFPKSPYAERALLWSAIYHFENDNLTKSEYLLRSILRDYLLTPLEPQVRLWLGKNYIRRGEYRSAKVELRHGLNSLPDFPQTPPRVEGELSYWLGEACERAEDMICARDAFHSVALNEGKDPLAALAMVRLAVVLEQLGDDTEARVWRKKSEEQIDDVILASSGRGSTGRSEREPRADRPAYEAREAERAADEGQEPLWVQAGSFSSRTNADQLRETLGENGLEASVKRVRIDGKNFYRVRLGPFPDREAAMVVLRNLRDIGVSGRILHGE
jgi:TolA-binding protein